MASNKVPRLATLGRGQISLHMLYLTNKIALLSPHLTLCEKKNNNLHLSDVAMERVALKKENGNSSTFENVASLHSKETALDKVGRRMNGSCSELRYV